MTAPLTLPRVPTAGPHGLRDNVERVRAMLRAMLPPGSVLIVDVAHDDGCPCERGRVSLRRCTCDAVDLTLSVINPRAS